MIRSFGSHKAFRYHLFPDGHLVKQWDYVQEYWSTLGLREGDTGRNSASCLSYGKGNHTAALTCTAPISADHLWNSVHITHESGSPVFVVSTSQIINFGEHIKFIKTKYFRINQIQNTFYSIALKYLVTWGKRYQNMLLLGKFV